jgi:transposase-like protein
MSQFIKSYASAEVLAKPSRRKFSRAYKLRILEEVAQCKHGEQGALLRREGLYYSMLASWRKEADAGTLGVKTRGRQKESEGAEVKRLEAENKRLKQKLMQAAAIIETPKKLAHLLESLKDERK